MHGDIGPALTRALVIGIFGGVGLVLTQAYSRRGPLIFPVYAALLFVLGWSLSRAAGLGFTARTAVALSGLLMSTLMSLAATVVLSARERRRLVASGRQFAPAGAPVWGFPLILLLLVAASAGVAFISL